MSPTLSLPVIDFSGVREGDASRRGAVAQQIIDACTSVGFFYISHHGIPENIIERALTSASEFFALPVDVKRQSNAINHRGYIGIGDALMKDATKTDFKESYVIGLELGPDDPSVIAGEPLRGPNIWPAATPSFQPDLYAYYEEVGDCGRALLSVVALALGQRETFFDGLYRKPLQRTNIIHYPPHPADSAPDQFGGAAHTDYGCITLLWQDSNGGLQVEDRQSKVWIEAKPIPGTFVVNVGDLLARWSNDRFASNLHRVINASGKERYSMATFFDPDFSAIADPRDFGASNQDARYDPVSAGDYILGRVRGSFEYRQEQLAKAAG